MEQKKIIPIWQPVGYSTHIIAKKVSEYFSQPTSHTGTLDPMAEGVIIVLVGDERNKKYEYAEWEKVYEFQVAFGLSTDSYDGLGLTDSVSLDGLNAQKIFTDAKNVVSEFVGEYVQSYPPYSAKTVEGKPLHWYARNEKLDTITIPNKKGEIFSLEVLETSEKNLESIVNRILSKIDKVTGDLRQGEVSKNWKEILAENNEKAKIPVVRFKAKMSKGLYVRTLANDIAQKIGKPGFVYSLTRTKNGAYTKQNSKELKDIFGSRFKKEYDFVSRMA